MGYMTVVSILNDGWGLLRENPDKFMENISRGMRGEYHGPVVKSYGVQGFSNPMEVHRSFHANESKLLLVGQNHMENVADMTPNRTDDFYLTYKVQTLQRAADALEFAQMQVFTVLADVIATAAHKQGKDPLQVAESFEAFNVLEKKERGIVFKMVEKLLNNDNRWAFK